MRAILFLLLAVDVEVRVLAQNTPPSCRAPEHRQFDFWLGTWAVFSPDGERVGSNVITLELNGCVLHERWESARGPHRGNSFNIYDRSSARWYQTWVDNTGLLLRLEGGLQNRAMVLEGRTRLPDGSEQRERITWTPQPDGVVRQLWERSNDLGGIWTIVFDGRYVRRP